jgi:hypothetical protein
MELTLEIKENEQELIEFIMSQFKEHINYALQGALTSIQNRLAENIRTSLMSSPTISSLLNGELKQAFGLVTPSQIIDNIVNSIINSMEIKQEDVQTVGTRIVGGGYTINISKSDFSDVLSIPNAEIITANNIVVPWLNWLLFAGDSPVVIGYVLQVDSKSPNSRTGAIMVKKPGASWSVPAEFAGVAADNFITRALLPLEATIGEIIQEEVSRRL